MTRKRELEFANLVCKFGDDKNLLDFAEEIVFPAFFDDSRVRRYSDTKYFFLDVTSFSIGRGENEVVCIAGEFVKDTEFTREQLFDRNKGLHPASGSLRTSPSSIFLLVLNNHRLVYLPKTSYAPGLK